MNDYIIEQEGNFCLVQRVSKKYIKLCSTNGHFINKYTGEEMGCSIDLTGLESKKDDYIFVSNKNDSNN